MNQHFGYAIDRRYLPVLLSFGLRGSKDGVTLSDDATVLATYGFVKLRTTRANVTGAHITRSYRWWTAIGARRSMADDGLSFGTNRDAGVCIHFAEKVPSPLRRRGHSALTSPWPTSKGSRGPWAATRRLHLSPDPKPARPASR